MVSRLTLDLVGLAARLESGLGQLARSLARPGTMSGLENPSGVLTRLEVLTLVEGRELTLAEPEV